MKTTLELIQDHKYSFPLEYDGIKFYYSDRHKNGKKEVTSDHVLEEINTMISMNTTSAGIYDVELYTGEQQAFGYLSIDMHDNCITVKFHQTDQLEECYECRGSGEVTCSECGNEKDCEECEGSGQLKYDDELTFKDDIVLKTIPLNQGELF